MSPASLPHAAACSAGPEGSLYNTLISAAGELLVHLRRTRTPSHCNHCFALVQLPALQCQYIADRDLWSLVSALSGKSMQRMPCPSPVACTSLQCCQARLQCVGGRIAGYLA